MTAIDRETTHARACYHTYPRVVADAHCLHTSGRVQTVSHSLPATLLMDFTLLTRHFGQPEL
jgi:hypothetical protein